MVKLKVKHDYKNGPRGFDWKAGQTIEVEPDVAHWLKVDAPGVFETVKPPAKRKPKSTAVAEPKPKSG